MPLCASGPLARYARWLQARVAPSAPSEGATLGISLPAALPFASSALTRPPSSRRRRARWRAIAQGRAWANQLVSLYNFLELGCPKGPGGYGSPDDYCSHSGGLAAWASGVVEDV